MKPTNMNPTEFQQIDKLPQRMTAEEDQVPYSGGICYECGSVTDVVLCQACYSQGMAYEYYKGAEDCRKALREALANPSCETCLHGQWDEDMSVGIPLHIEDCPYMPEEQMLDDTYRDTYRLMSSICGHWTLNPNYIGPQF